MPIPWHPKLHQWKSIYYLRAMAYYKLGENDLGCTDLEVAGFLEYPQARLAMEAYCKNSEPAD